MYIMENIIAVGWIKVVCRKVLKYDIPYAMQKILCLLAALVLFCPLSARATETISEIVSDQRDYMVEGDIVTIWDEGFLFDDGTGQIVVDLRPNDGFQLGLQGRQTVMVLGRLQPDDSFKPKFIILPGGEQISFTGTEALPPMDMAKVMANTNRYRKPRSIVGNSGMPHTGGGSGSAGGSSAVAAASDTAASTTGSDYNPQPGSGMAGSTANPGSEPSTAGTPLAANSPILQKAKEAAAQAIANAKANAPTGAPTDKP